MGRRAFYLANKIAHFYGRGQSDQQMYVIRHYIMTNRPTTAFLGLLIEDLQQTRPMFTPDQSAASAGCPGKMIIELMEGMPHSRLLPIFISPPEGSWWKKKKSLWHSVSQA